MMRLMAALITAMAALAGIWAGPSDLELTSEAPILRSTVYKPPPTTTTTLVPPDALCGEWWPAAVMAGWDTADLPTLDRVIYNETRCQNGLRSPTDDVGLTQLHVPVHAHLWETDGWTTGQVQASPVLNLYYARKVADIAASYGWCQWQPWHNYSGDYC